MWAATPIIRYKCKYFRNCENTWWGIFYYPGIYNAVVNMHGHKYYDGYVAIYLGFIWCHKRTEMLSRNIK